MKLNMKFILRLALEIVMALAVMPAVSAQTSQAERDRAENERELEIRVWNLRMLSEQSLKSRKKRRDVQQELTQLQEDFTRIQVVNKRLGRAALGSGALDLRFVSQSADEIKQCAERLNTNLSLPELDVGNQAPASAPIAGPEQIKSSILRLARVVFRFVDNPFFKEVSVVDKEFATRARSDLAEIIELSEHLRKVATTLKKH